MANTRIYSVIDKAGKERMVDANSTAAAMRHISGQDYSIAVATAKQVAAFCQAGGKVENAGEDSTPPDDVQ